MKLGKPPVNTYIQEIETASLLQGIWPNICCGFCGKELGAKQEGVISVSQPLCYTVGFQTAFHDGKLYLGLGAEACSEEHAQQFLAKEKWPGAPEYSGDRHPSEMTQQGRTIYAVRQTSDYPQDTLHSGKWLLFPSTDEVDQTWPVIREATKQGKFGGYSKVVYNPRKTESVMCIYTYDYQDRTDILRVRQELRALGFTRKLAYKADETTMKGIYRQPGQRVSLYYE